MVSDAISGVKEQELLQIGNLAIVLALRYCTITIVLFRHLLYTLGGMVPQ